MKRDRILNPRLIEAIAAIGHTQTLVIADAGLPVPQGVPCIDISLVRSVPSYLDTLQAVASELVVESYIVASEMPAANPTGHAKTAEILAGLPQRTVPHEEFKALCKTASAIVRTGETSSFTNIILVAGVNF